MKLKSRLVVVLACVMLPWLGATPAGAGTFDVLACDAAPGFANNSWRPDVNHGGMVAFTACPSGDNQMLGLGLRNGYYPSGWTVPTGTASRWVFDAPPATAIVGIRANAYFEQKHFRWQVGLSNGAQLLVGCPSTSSSTGGTCGAHMTAGEYLPLPWSGALYTEVFCAQGPCPVGGGGYYGWASMTWVAVTVLDETAPSILNPAGDLWGERWVSGTRQVTFDAVDNTGIKDVRVLIDGREKARAGRGCDPGARTCPDWPGAGLDVSTAGGLADGAHELGIQAVDRGNNVGGISRRVYIDNTPPAAPSELTVDGGDGWKPANSFSVRWKNPPQNAAPIAGADYQLCPASPTAGQCVSGAKASTSVTELRDVQVPRPGAWTLKLWLRDAAGKGRPESAAPPVQLRFDPDPPSLGFRPLDPGDPSRVAVEAADATSGVARGEIELRRRGARTWRALPAQLDASGFAAALDDEHMRDGLYELRARAWDAAGNERSTDRRTSGEPATLLLPVRIKTRMRVGVEWSTERR